MTLNELGKDILNRYFEKTSITKGVFQSEIRSDGMLIFVVDDFNNILNLMESNIEKLLGFRKTNELYKELGVVNKSKYHLDDPMLYLKCDELKLVSNTSNDMHHKIYKINHNIQNLSKFYRLVKENESSFIFCGYLIEIIRESKIYKGEN